MASGEAESDNVGTVSTVCGAAESQATKPITANTPTINPKTLALFAINA
jgi:hypothetical protein